MSSTNLEQALKTSNQLQLKLVLADNEKLRSLIERTQAETNRIQAETALEIEKGTAIALDAIVAREQLNTQIQLAKIRYGIEFHEIPPIPCILEQVKSG